MILHTLSHIGKQKHIAVRNNIRNNIINTKVLLRTIFINALTYKIHDSILSIEYLSDGMEELENIQLKI